VTSLAALTDREVELLETFLALIKQGERDSDRFTGWQQRS
jgi:hypothetical protein